jgi:hypothetical protein
VSSLKRFIKRATLVELIVPLSILAGCSSERVTSPGPKVVPPSTIDVAYCSGQQPDWVAFQDGDGPWIKGQSFADGPRVTFRHVFTTDRAAIAYVRLLPNGLTSLAVQYSAPAEVATVGFTDPAQCGSVVSKTLLGTVAGVDVNDFAIISAGFGSRDFVAPVEGISTFALSALLSGPQEVLATRATRVNGSSVPTRIILRRTPELPDSATLPVLDFNSAEAFAPQVANVAIVGLGSEGAQLITQLLTAHSRNEIAVLTGPAGPTRPFYGVPDSKLEPGDLHVLNVTANPTTANSVRSALVYFHSAVDQTLTLGAPATVPAFSTVGTTPSLRLRARFDLQQDYDRITSINYQQGQTTLVNVAMSAAYVARAGNGYDLIVPDLSGATGFDARWTLRAGEPVFWIATRTGGTLGLGVSPVPTNGATSRTALTFDTFTP